MNTKSIENGYYSLVKYNQWCINKFGMILVIELR